MQPAEICLAPMLRITTPQFRLLMRKISPQTLLFTEMIVAATVTHASAEKLHSILGVPDGLTVVQVGGADPDEIARSVAILKAMGWRSFNLNCGCPSDRVQSGKFGAVLMLDPALVAEIINEVHRQTGEVLSLKIRTGVDDHDTFDFFRGFVEYVITHTPCTRFYVHARKCWLSGVSPKHNRNVPPLNYQFLYDIKALHPHLFISLNGGVKENSMDKLKNLDGLMIGRHAVENIGIFNIYGQQCSGLKLPVKAYLEEVGTHSCSRSRMLLPLNNIRKGRALNKAFRVVLNQMIRSDFGMEEVYEHIKDFIE